MMTAKKWKKNEMADFLIRIGDFMQRGYSLANSLELYAMNERGEIQRHIAHILNQLKNGERLPDILEQFSFPGDIVASLYFFEHYNLPEGFIYSGQILEKREIFKERLQKILQYPLFLIWLTSMMAYMLLRYLIPQFSTLYSSIGSGLPAPSLLIISIVKSLPFVFLSALVCLLISVLAFHIKMRNRSPRAKLMALLNIPFVRQLTKLLITQRFSLNLSSLLQAGISINKAFRIFEQQKYSPFFQQEAVEIKFRLLSGESLENIMLGRHLYQKELAAIIKHGQINGKLADELAIYSELLFHKVEAFIIKTLNIIQPIIFTIVGFIVLLMFLAVMLPMLQFMQSL